jgi:hypothetical protein
VPAVIAAYLGAYGPSTPETFDAWLTRGYLKKSTLRGWFAALGDQLTEIDVDGQVGYLLTEHADDLASTSRSTSRPTQPAAVVAGTCPAISGR